MNSYVRFKLALTEDDPTIRPLSGGPPGGAAGSKDSTDRAVACAAGLFAPPLEPGVAGDPARAVEADLPPSGARPDDAREEPRVIRVARTPPRGARQGVTGADGMVGSGSGFEFSGSVGRFTHPGIEPRRSSLEPRNPEPYAFTPGHSASTPGNSWLRAALRSCAASCLSGASRTAAQRTPGFPRVATTP